MLPGPAGTSAPPAKLKAPKGDKQAGVLASRHLQIVWPTEQEIRNSTEGWMAGASVPGTVNNTSKDFLRPLWHRQALRQWICWAFCPAHMQATCQRHPSWISLFEWPCSCLTCRPVSLAQTGMGPPKHGWQ